MDLVKLISYTRPADEGSLEDIVAYCARVSNPKNQNNPSTEKLLKYLMENKHWSPFEMVNICLEINTTRDIARQILRHRSFHFQEYSQRYADPTRLGFQLREARLQDKTNRQNSLETDNNYLHIMWKAVQSRAKAEAIYAYEWALDQGLAKEVARCVLPEGMTDSRLYMNGTLRSWIHYIDLRISNGTQKEHKNIAALCKREIATVFPLINQIITEEN